MMNAKNRYRTVAMLLAAALMTGTVEGTTAPEIVWGAQSDTTFDEAMRRAGFPESYLGSLRELHKKYPNWQFEVVETGLDWDTVIAKESRPGYSLVPKTSDDARKSTEGSAYNWYTNVWKIYDGSSWVAANAAYVAHCMDPRNYLNENDIFQFEKLSYSENQTRAGVASIVKGSFLENEVKDTDGEKLSYIDALVKIGKQTGVSPYHLASRLRQEQGTAGTSKLISGDYAGYEGYFNYFNVGAYGTTKDKVYQAGLAYAKSVGWNSRYKALLGGATILAKNYISVGQDTLYFQKFNVVSRSSGLYTHQYMTNVAAAVNEGRSLGNGYTDKTQAFVFRIPVYLNMPKNPAAAPTGGNPNNYLKKLLVGGMPLTPAFDAAVNEYSVTVSGNDKVLIEAVPVAATSKVTGAGEVTLKKGANTVKVVCTAQNGTANTYKITITRQAGSGNGSSTQKPDQTAADKNKTPLPVGKLTSTQYTVGNQYVTGIAPGTKATAVAGSLSAKNGTVSITKADGSKNTDLAGTGSKVVIKDSSGAVVAGYEILLYGDVNGDGAITIQDMEKINNHVMGRETLSGIWLKAADANRDGKVNMMDMVTINEHVLDIEEIFQ